MANHPTEPCGEGQGPCVVAPDGHHDHEHGHAHPHDHGRGHDHAHDHQHHPAGAPLGKALLLIAAFAGVEAVAGFLAGSLALIGDAGHMLTDATALALAWMAQHLAKAPADHRYSYGWRRAEVLAAALNAVLLLALIAWLVWEAVQRLAHPPAIQGPVVIVVGVLGLIINLLVLRLLHGHHDLNTRAAMLHVMADTLGSVAAVTAGLLVWRWGWNWADPLLSLVIAGLMVGSTMRLLWGALQVLLEAVPHNVDYAGVGQRLAAVPGVRAVHDLHIWSIGPGQIALTGHLDMNALDQWPQVLQQARHLLRTDFGIEHVTLQPELPLNPAWADKPRIPLHVVRSEQPPVPPHAH